MINWSSLIVIWFIVYVMKQRRNQQAPSPPSTTTDPPSTTPYQPPVVIPPPSIDNSKHEREQKMDTLFPFLIGVRADTHTETVNPNKQQYFLEDLKQTVTKMFQIDGKSVLKQNFEMNLQRYNNLYGPVFAG